MPAVTPRGGGSRRRTISEINMVPFIDVMLVLLIIFMVSAPLITTGVVDLPTVGKASSKPDRVVEVVVGTDDALKLRVGGKDQGSTSLNRLVTDVQSALQGTENAPVVISADKAVKYEAVVRVMDLLRRGGVQRVGLLTKTTG
ncbi:ExbD/TolR family protein [Caldimonas thermodepolymerans]|jgi:Biopolymer transport protein|uniref:ExbD/TolR family protein n=1 Tax=Caldimonas thermodepolymerans TaxID=215580 RepID=UPI002491AEED|nr:ExbD/TolR family protein [Caldimonas thermodepolymerans]